MYKQKTWQDTHMELDLEFTFRKITYDMIYNDDEDDDNDELWDKFA